MATAKKKPAKKPTKKAAAKKATPKKKVVAKKSASKKPAPKKIAKKAVAKKSAPAKKAVIKPAPKTKLVDLSDFVTPLDDRLIVQVSAVERKTAGGLFLPDTVSDTSGNLQGVVVAVGRGHRSPKGHLTPMDVQRGDVIVFAEFTGAKIKMQNEELIILRESEVMGILA